jgi:hypothetical protein
MYVCKQIVEKKMSLLKRSLPFSRYALLLGLTYSNAAFAGVIEAQNWLIASTDNSQQAMNWQAIDEKLRTLLLLKINNTAQIDVNTLLQSEHSTEGLVRAATITNIQHADFSIVSLYLTQVLDHQNADGGFGHLQDWQSNPLDTAYFLLAVHDTDLFNHLSSETEKVRWNTAIAKSLNYLQTQQRTNGSYQVLSVDQLYVSAYVLNAITPYISQYPMWVSTAKSLIDFLQNSQIAPAQWSNHPQGLFIDALVAEALHPYHQMNDQSVENLFKSRVESLQQSNGSWANDVYTTALVVRSMQQQTQINANPLSISLALQVIDAETGLPLPDVRLKAVGQSNLALLSNGQGEIYTESLMPSTYQMQLSRAGYDSLSFDMRLLAAQHLNLGQFKLSRTITSNAQVAQLQGRVTDSTGVDVSGAIVTVVMVDESGHPLPDIKPIQTFTNNNGQYQVLLPQAGAYGIDIRKDAYGAVQANGAVELGGVGLFSPSLTAIGNFLANAKGRVIDQNGVPIFGAVLKSASGQTLTTTDNNGLFVMTLSDHSMQSWQIEKNGKMAAQLSVAAQNGQTFDFGSITLPDVPSNTAASNTVIYVPTTEVSLHPSDQDTQENIYAFNVVAEQLDAAGSVIHRESFLPPAADAYAVSIHLTAGRWRLSVQQDAYQSSVQEIDISTQALTLEPQLKIKPYAIKMRLIDAKTGASLDNVNALVNIYDNRTNELLFSEVTDWLGRMPTYNKYNQLALFDRRKLRIEIKPNNYASSLLYVDKSFYQGSVVDLGEIRLRQKTKNIDLADLKFTKISSVGLKTDQQSLLMSGKINFSIINNGLLDAPKQPFKIQAFVDVNKDKNLDSGDLILGEKSIQSGIEKGKNIDDYINIQGKSLFRDAPILLKIDVENSIPELDEKNNIRGTQDGLYGLSEPVLKMHYGGEDMSDPRGEWSEGSAAAPIAVPLYDTNGDGKVTQDDDIYLIYATYKRMFSVVNAKTGKLAFRIPDTSIYQTAAVADLDKDGQPEILKFRANYLDIYSNKGIFLREENMPFSDDPIIDDLDGDGYPEIISNSKILHTKDWSLDWIDSMVMGARDAVDLDGDGKKELISWRAIGNSDGSLRFYLKGGFNVDITSESVADLDLDGKPEIIIPGKYLEVFDSNGQLKFSVPNVSFGMGAAVIADVDGDGYPEIGLCGLTSFSVYKGDGSLLWTAPTQDISSSQTSASAFDFDGDGANEIVYDDENFIRIFDGKTGNVLYKIPNEDGTLREYPIIADVDHDGHADIVAVGQVGSLTSHSGVRVFSGKDNNWAPTRPIWNTYNYRVTNINDDLTVPAHENPHWKTHNSVRTALVTAQNRADLTTSFIQVTDNGWLSDSTLKARVGNAGGKSVPAGTPVSFYRIPPAINGVTQAPILLQVATLSKTLEAGDYEDIALTYAGSLAGFGELVVVANDAGAGIDSLTGIIAGQTQSAVIQEFTRSNNMARLSIGGGFQSYTLSGSLDQPTYQVAQNVQITAQATNLGSFDADATVRMTVLDQVGNVLAVLPTQSVTLLAGSNQRVSVHNTWNTGNQRAGAYHVRIELIRPSLLGNADVVAQAEQNFNIGVDAAVAGLTDARLFADKATYSSGDVVQATLQLRNTASNQVAGPRTTTVSLQSPTGEIIWTQQTHVDQLSPNRLNEQSWRIALNQAVAGQYILRSTTHADDGIQPDQVRSQALTVLSNAATLVGVSGTLTSSLTQANVGDAVHFQWSVRNQGAALDQLPARIVLINTNTGQRVGPTIYQGNITLAKQSTLSPQTTAWLSSIEPAQLDQPLMAMLQVQLQNGLSGEDQWRGLAQQPIKITQPPLKIEIGVDGEDGVQGKANGAPLLVYYNCHEGWDTLVTHWSAGIFVDQCFTQRAAQIKPYLDRLNIPYTLVKSPWDFKAQLRSGVYGQYWMLGAVEQLQPDSVYELRETAHLGDGLLVDSGMHSWSNEHLFMLAGADPKGRLRLTDGVITPQTIASNSTVPPLLRTPNDTNVAAAVLKTMTPRRGQPYAHNWPTLLEPLTPYTQIAATFDGRQRLDVWFAALQGKPASSLPQVQYPAITTAPYGRGYPVGVAFDLISTLQNASLSTAQPNYAQQRWDQVLADFSRPRRSTAKIAYAPAEPIRIPVRLNNQSNSSRIIKVVVDLPSGSTWLGHMGGLTTTQNGQIEQQTSATQVSFTVTLAAQAKQTELLTLRLPKTAGTAVVRTSLYPVQNGVAGVALAQQESRFIIRSIDEHLNLLNQTIGRWNSIGTNGVAVTLLKVKLKLIETHLKLGLTELALDETSRMGNTLASMTTTPTQDIMKVRLETDELMKALEIKWYLECADKKPK